MATANPPTLAHLLETQDVERMQRYREYLAFYQGEQWRERRRAGETRLTVNYARALVRKTASYLMPRPATFNVLASDGGPSPRSTAAEQALAEVHAANDLHILDLQSAVDSAVLGDGAFKLTWNERRNLPLVAAVDPQTLWAWWPPGNPGKVRRVVQRSELPVEDAAALFGLALPERPAQVTVVEEWTAERYQVEIGNQVVRDEANPYGWIPYVLYPNLARPHEFWGASDLEDLLDICRELNRRMTTVSRILDVAGYPITVLENVTGSEGIRIDAGAVWELPEDSRAYLLDLLQGGGVRLHIDYIDLLYRQLHDLSETPRTAFGDSGRMLSGAALEVEIQPLVQKVMRKRRVWDRVYRQRNAMILEMLERWGGRDFGGLRRTETIWGEILPSDREALTRSAVSLVEAGIQSRRDAMASLGDANPEASWARVLEERVQGIGYREPGNANASSFSADPR
jgi:hypothetical protein